MINKKVSYIILVSFIFILSFGVISYGMSSYFTKEVKVDLGEYFVDIPLEGDKEEVIEPIIQKGEQTEETDEKIENSETEKNNF